MQRKFWLGVKIWEKILQLEEFLATVRIYLLGCTKYKLRLKSIIITGVCT